MKYFRYILLTILFICLTSCGFHSPKLNDYPAAIHTLYIDAEEPNDPLTTEVTRRLKGLGFDIVSSAQQANVQLYIAKPTFTMSQPTIFYGANAINYGYSLSTRYQLRTRSGQPLSPERPVAVSQNLLHNANQAYASGADVQMRYELMLTTASIILFDLSNVKINDAIKTRTTR